MKILHITTDNKFISAALNTFESVYPNQNTIWMLNEGGEVNVSNNRYDKVFSLKQTFLPSFLSKLKKFDLVILHSLIIQWYPLIVFAPRGLKFAWLGWGYDYYNYIYDDSRQLLLTDTLKIEDYLRDSKEIHSTVKSFVKYPAKIVFNKIFIKVALKRITSFSPVIKEDYELIRNAKIIPSLPEFLPWNYGSLEKDLVRNFIGQRVNGSCILLGNSASITNNHIDAFELLSQLQLAGTHKVFTPLSYGDNQYKKVVIEEGKRRLNDTFYPIVEFMPIDDYVALIRKCGYVIMNHKRQQALGNIVIMLYLGARVFLREENPVYKMLKKEGAFISTVQELQKNKALLQTPLSEQEIQKNIEILYNRWSRETIDNNTANLVEFHLGTQS